MNFERLYNDAVNENKLTKSLGSIALASTLATSPVNADTIKRPDNQPQVQQVKTINGYSTEQTKNIIARTLWAEARNDGALGMRAVADVIYNRARGDLNRYVDVIKKPYQFSCWNGMSPDDWNPEKFRMKTKNDKEWGIANAIADEMVNRTYTPGNTKYDHYYNPSKVTPYWDEGGKLPGKMIGSHKFLDISKTWDTK